MTGILLVSHPGIASAILEQARAIVGKPLEGMAAFEVETCRAEAELRAAADAVDRGDGLLVLVDLPGATPCNLVSKTLLRDHRHCRSVTGLNLPMAIRAWNYRDRPLDELVEIAAEGGLRGVTTP